MRNFSKRMASLVFVQTVAASSLSSDNACLGVKTAYRSLQCCPSGAAAASLDGALQAAKTGRDALAAVDVPPFKGKICVDSGASTPTFNIGVGEAKAFYDFWKLPDNSGTGTWLPHYPWLNGSKFYARKAGCPAENMVYLWLQEEFATAIPKPSLCDPVAEAFTKFTRTAYDMEYEANVRPNLVNGTLGCYMFPIVGPPYSDSVPSYCTGPRLTKDVATRPLNLDPVAIRRFVAGTMAGPEIVNPYTAPYVYFTTLAQGLAMMHASFAYAEATKLYAGASYPDKICGPYTGPSVPACEFLTMGTFGPVATGVEVCLYKDYGAVPGTNEIAAVPFFQAMWGCGAGGTDGVVPAMALNMEIGVGRSATRSGSTAIPYLTSLATAYE